ncbi:MAG: 50S ribosomal protein L11 methyltransferase [Hydrogenothermus sp.]|nr:MAG: 50S ribosomal protein L11 methyltransferase [Hydrogenothermus sp.]
MKKLVYSIPSELFEIFLVELNGYGVEILNRDNNETVFVIYAEDKELKTVKEAVDEIFEDLGNGKLILEEEIEEKNWEEVWKEGIKPIEIPPFILIPEWEIYEGNELIPIKLKIGMAFGTGYHATTQIMLSLIPKYISQGDTVLDAGCGSGVLAIASKKLGASRVLAVDIQDEAIEECKTNAWENEVEIECKKVSVDEIKENFDIVLANIQIDVFRKVFNHLANRFNKYLIVSGIFKDKEKDELLNMAEKSNLILVEETSKPEDPNKLGDLWYGFVFKEKN